MCKYYWCAGWTDEPLELPIGSINLARIADEKTQKNKGLSKIFPCIKGNSFFYSVFLSCSFLFISLAWVEAIL